MTWEIAIIVGMLGVAFILLLIGFFNREEQERRFPLKLIFITLAILFAMGTLRLSTQVVYANEVAINNTVITTSLANTIDTSFVVMIWLFWLFAIVTVLSIIVSAVEALRKAGRGR
jgi:multisubunit Na+/H+ antiporter MnhB subunit